MRIKDISKLLKLILITVLMSSFALVGCGNTKDNTKQESDATVVKNESSNEDAVKENKDLPLATITIEGYGVIEAELYPEIAPNTVNNFIDLANKGFYNNQKFHRVIKNFMIQGGDPKGNGTGGPGYSIEGEFTSNGFANSLKHTKGVLSMARSQDHNSAGSQFFIMTKEASHLDGEYAAFGKMISGLDVLEKIENVKTDSNDKPKEDVVIKSITVDTRGITYKEPIKK
jgi:peptidyl-prolyl cis-trans isomerase B (cyclophilin B)